MPRIRLDLAYDGTDFAGWAKQPGLRSCQGELERALETIAREPVRMVVAGRTDAGVHASGQVVHADVPAAVLPEDMQKLAPRLSKLAAPSGDLVVKSVSLAPAGFDARFSANARSYRYRVLTGFPDPLERRTAAFIKEQPDLETLRQVSASLIGLHDFAAFCKPREGATTIRRLLEFDWRQAGGVYEAQLRADAFCHSMVRALVSACLRVGTGKLNLAAAVALLEQPARSALTGLMPAAGLTLTAVHYPPAEDLALQAELTRARRDRADIEAAVDAS